MASKTDRYWRQFLNSLPGAGDRPDGCSGFFSFGVTTEDASDIARLVVSGRKTATGSLLWSFEAEGKPIPKPGDHWIVVDGNGDPVCIIRTLHVTVIPYDEVPESYAHEGAEGDGTLKTWRPLYWRYIVSECSRLNRTPVEQTPLVMERFAVIYKEPMI